MYSYDTLLACIVMSFVVSGCFWFIIGRVVSKESTLDSRYQGWIDCQDMVISRIRKNYPDISKELIDKLLA